MDWIRSIAAIARGGRGSYCLPPKRMGTSTDSVTLLPKRSETSCSSRILLRATRGRVILQPEISGTSCSAGVLLPSGIDWLRPGLSSGTDWLVMG